MSTPQKPQTSECFTARTSSAFGGALFLDGPAMRVKRLDKKTKACIDGMLRRSEHRAWCLRHGKTLPPPRLHPVILRVIREWFDLVDDDGSGTLEHHELLAALQAAQIPCDAASISEMIKLMDANRDGCIGWGEFESFMMDELAGGKQLLSGEYVLPSGMALPFGVMIRQLKRTQMMQEITQGGETRRKWLHYTVDLSAVARAVAEQEEAIRSQRAFNETLHNRVAVEMQPNGNTEAQQQQQAADSSTSASSANLGGTAAAAAAAHCRTSLGDVEAAASATVQPGSTVVQPGSTVVLPATVPVVAGVPVMSAILLSPSAHALRHQQQQQQQQRRSSTAGGVPQSLLDSMHAMAAAAAQATAHTIAAAATAAAAGVLNEGAAGAGGCVQGRGNGAPLVPRLQLAGVLGMKGACSSSSSSNTTSKRGNAAAMEQQREWGSSAVIESGSVLATARASYWLRDAAATGQTAAAAAADSSSSSSVADHLYQQRQLSLQLQADCTSSPRGSTTPVCSAAAGSSARQYNGGGAGSTTAGRYRSPSSPHHVLQPQPCRDEWGVITASGIARRHSACCRDSAALEAAAAGVKSSRNGMQKSSRNGMQTEWNLNGQSCSTAAGPPHLPQQQQQQQPHAAGAVVVSTEQCCAAAAASSTRALCTAQQAVLSQQTYSCREVCMKHLLTARVTPPASLLSQGYVGPVAAAIMAWDTSRPAAAAAAAAAAVSSTGDSSAPLAAAAAAAAGTARDSCTPRSARTVVVTNAGNAVTVGGQVVKYLPSPRQRPVCSSSSSSSTSAGMYDDAAWGSGSGLLGSSCVAAGAGASRGGDAHEAGLCRGSRCSGIAAAAAAACSSGAQPLLTPRHSALAQKLVRAHGSLGGESAGLPKQMLSKEQQQQEQQGSCRDKDPSSSSHSGSLCSSMMQKGGQQQQQQRVVVPGGSCSTESSLQPLEVISNAGSSISAAADAGKRKCTVHKQQSVKQRLSRACQPEQESTARPTAAAGRLTAAAAAAKAGKHYAASGPLGGRHPAYVNAYTPGGGSSTSGASTAGSSSSGHVVHSRWDGHGVVSTLQCAVLPSGGFDSFMGGISVAEVNGIGYCVKAVSPRLSYSGLSPRARKL